MLDLVRVNIRFRMSDSPPEVTNALQKACSTEQDGYSLHVTYTDVHTNDENMNKVELVNNINLIPLNYDAIDYTYTSVRLSINVKNNGNSQMAVATIDIDVKGYKLGTKLFHPSYVIIYLTPGKSLSVQNIRIQKGNTRDHTKYLTAPVPFIWPRDRGPGDSTTKSTPMIHDVGFNINSASPNGKNYAEKMIQSGCKDLIVRLTRLEHIVSTDDKLYVEKYENSYIVRVEETNGIAKMLEVVCIGLFPDVEYFTAELVYHTKLVTIHVTGINAKSQLLATIKDCIRIYKSVHDQISY